ncbi:MAG: succinyl-diaminopimelate desuccinylase [Actinomycetota bacterium]|nr:succinyl-diaminopimelate desuccinylase [Actinomycetota bacterium]
MDLLARTAELIDIPSVSHNERALADHVEQVLLRVPWLTVDRVEDNVVARTNLARAQRIVLAGHLDTVPANGNERARVAGDVLWGLGAADMKSGLAVMLALASALAETAVDVTYVFYAGEEVARQYNGLSRLLTTRPDLLDGDAAILGEPTGAVVEAGCQGVIKLDVVLGGERAHTARPWMGVNAIHRLGPLLDRVAAFEGREPVIDGCQYREALQAVHVSGGVAGNVVPDLARLSLNHRFAPDRSPHQAETAIRELIAPALDAGRGDRVELVEAAPAARPGLEHPLLRRLVVAAGAAPRAKLGWTDVAFFTEQGIPAANFGPGDPSVSHTAAERVDRSEINAVHRALVGLLTAGVDDPATSAAAR